jgi:hypothetical protein
MTHDDTFNTALAILENMAKLLRANGNPNSVCVLNYVRDPDGTIPQRVRLEVLLDITPVMPKE